MTGDTIKSVSLIYYVFNNISANIVEDEILLRLQLNTLDIVAAHVIIYRVYQEESTILLEKVPYLQIHRYNQPYLYPKLNCYGDDERKLSSCGSTYCTCLT